MLKKILLSLLVVIVVFAGIGFLLPREVSVTRTAVVHAPATYVFDEFNDLTRWGGWNYWNQVDTAMTITYGDKTQGVGAHYAWDGPINDKGTITITESKPAEQVKLEINFGGNPAIGTYTTEALGDSTEVTMNLTADMGLNPVGRWIGLFMQKEIDKAFAYSLNKLEEINRAKPRFSIPLAIEETSGFSYVGLTHTMSPQDADAVAAQTSKMFGELLGDLKRANVSLAGAPLCLYPRYTLESMDFVCAVPVLSNTKVPAKYKIAHVAPGWAAKAVHYGSYGTLQGTHDQLVKFIPFSGYEEAGGPWEVYVTDPELETDTAKWVTEVYYPVKKK